VVGSGGGWIGVLEGWVWEGYLCAIVKVCKGGWTHECYSGVKSFQEMESLVLVYMKFNNRRYEMRSLTLLTGICRSLRTKRIDVELPPLLCVEQNHKVEGSSISCRDCLWLLMFNV
jgi:hypothetical protein